MNSLAELRAQPAEAILKNGRGTGPVVDGWLIPEDVGTVFAEANASALRDFRDQMAWVMRNWARLETNTGRSKAYVYYFTHQPPGAKAGGRGRGATHTAEIPYVFENQGNRPWADVDRQISNLMSSYGVNFAATGDPNAKGLPKWPAFETRTRWCSAIAPPPGPDSMRPRSRFIRRFTTSSGRRYAEAGISNGSSALPP